MRLLHTSDWHLGARFHELDRAEDEQHALDQIRALCVREQVDCLLIAGDVFDTASPGAAEVGRYFRFLHQVVAYGIGTVVVIAGNHDGAMRLDGPRDLLAHLRVHVVGAFTRDEDPARCLVELRDRAGDVRAMCAAVPYLRDGDLWLPEAGEMPPPKRHAEALVARYAQVHALVPREMPLVVMGHCFANGGLTEAIASERPVQVGNLGKVGAELLGGNAAYLALGHLHRPQPVAKREHWRYCGSLLPMSFAETAQAREVVIADVPAGGGPANIRCIELAPYRQYRRLAGDVETLMKVLEKLPRPALGMVQPWCELTVDLSGPRPGLTQELMEAAAAAGWVAVKIQKAGEVTTIAGVGAADVAGLEDLDPAEVFRRRHRALYDGSEPDTDLTAAFAGLLARAQAAPTDPSPRDATHAH